MLIHAISQRAFTNTVTAKSELKVDWEKNLLPYLWIKQASVLHLAFQPNALPTEQTHPEYVPPTTHYHISTNLTEQTIQNTDFLLSMYVDIEICLLTGQNYNIIHKYTQYLKTKFYSVIHTVY